MDTGITNFYVRGKTNQLSHAQPPFIIWLKSVYIFSLEIRLEPGCMFLQTACVKSSLILQPSVRKWHC